MATAARYAAHVSLTTGSNPSVNAAITQIPDTAWTAIHYPDAFVDTETGELVSDAEVAEIGYTAFTSRPKKLQVSGRLIVRRVKRLNPKNTPGQEGLLDVWRHHAVFVTSQFETPQAETQHRGHASAAPPAWPDAAPARGASRVAGGAIHASGNRPIRVHGT